MKKLTLVLVFLCLAGTNAFAAKTKMFGVGLVCRAQTDFFAFNLSQNIVWVGTGAYKNQALAEQVYDLKAEQNFGVFTYRGTFDQQKIKGLPLEGILTLRNNPVSNKIKIAGEPRNYMTMYCQLPPN